MLLYNGIVTEALLEVELPNKVKAMINELTFIYMCIHCMA